MLRTLVIISNQIVLTFGVLIAFLSPKQSVIEESSLESIAKMSGQGVRTHHRNGGETWVVAGCRNDVARLAHFSQ